MPLTAADKISQAEVDQKLTTLNGWEFSKEHNAIEKEYERKNFLDSVSFIQQIAQAAEKHDHHPDVLLHDYKKVRVMFSTHSAGGITQNDFDMAYAVDA